MGAPAGQTVPGGRRERAAGAMERSGLGRLLRAVGAWRGLLVLNYHHIAADADAVGDPGVWSATPKALDAQLTLARRHLELVGPDALRSPPSRRRARLMVTFDDGYRSNHELALPVLAAHGVEAVFFLTTGFIDRPRLPWWEQIAAMVRASEAERPAATLERLRAQYEALPESGRREFLEQLAARLGTPLDDEPRPDLWMTWGMVRELRAAGMAVGGHTVDHPVLAQLAPAEQAREIEGSLARIEAELGERSTLFSYPYGVRNSFDERTIAALRDAGVEFSFSYYGGHNPRRGWNPYDIRRVSVSAAASPRMFAGTLTLPQVFAPW